MFSKLYKRAVLITIMVIMGMLTASAQDNITRGYDNDNDYSERSRIDRYLDVELWTNHSDDEFYEGDNIIIYYRANRDAFIAIYTVDTRGRVNLLFPTSPSDDNFIRGGATYSLPGSGDNFNLEVNGPEGVENIQIIASRDKFPIPDWYSRSGIVCDWDDRYDFMDYLNERYFVRYDGQRFAYDRVAIIVDRWEPDYYRPVYWPVYPTWSVYGNVYIDYPWGGTVYINGIYWGCAPLYIPRLLVGWHTITIYDPWGYCWESDFHVSRYNTVIFDRTIIVTKAHVISRYSSNKIGYRDPVSHGYPNFKQHVIASNKTTVKNNISTGGNIKSGDKQIASVDNDITLKKSYIRGSARLVKSDRGYETDNSYIDVQKQSQKTKRTTVNEYKSSGVSQSGTAKSDKSSLSGKSRTTNSSDNSFESRQSKSSSDDSEYYRKKTVTTQKKTERSTTSGQLKQNRQEGADQPTQPQEKVERSKIEKSSGNTPKSEKSTGTVKQSSPKKTASSSSTVGNSTPKSAPSKSPSSGSVKTSKSDASSGGKQKR